MTDKYKILGQVNNTESASVIVNVPVADETTVDSVVVSPHSASSLYQVLVTSLYVCEMTGSLTDTLYEVYVDPADSSTNSYLFKNRSLAKNATDILDIKLTLSPGDKVYVRSTSVAGAANVDFTAFGIEMVSGFGPS
jgi:hypothetical protein|tara:strand:- start:76 stop:486 length:411 start_codon:yes stop_codon:yes gene_type:complete